MNAIVEAVLILFFLTLAITIYFYFKQAVIIDNTVLLKDSLFLSEIINSTNGMIKVYMPPRRMLTCNELYQRGVGVSYPVNVSKTTDECFVSSEVAVIETNSTHLFLIERH